MPSHQTALAQELKQKIRDEDLTKNATLCSINQQIFPLIPEIQKDFCPNSPSHRYQVRLHNSVGFITPADYLAGRASAIWAERDRKIEAACRRSLREKLTSEPRAA